MQITQTSEQGLKREFRVVIPSGDLDRKVEQRLQTIGQSVRVPGFRPGKAPVNLLKKQYGKAVLGEVIDESVNEATQAAIRDHRLRPAMQPKIEDVKFSEGADFEYTMQVELLPEFVVGDFAKIALERLVAEVPEAEVETMLGRLAEQQKSFEAVTEARPAAKGDALLIDFVGKIGGVPFEGGKAEGFSVELGSGTFIPGFEDKLVGASAGDHLSFDIEFPADYGNKELAGKAATFDVDVKELRAAKPVAIDDELAKRMGLDNLDALKTALRQQIEQGYGEMSKAKLKRGLLDALARMHDFPVPGGMAELEFEQIWKQLQEDPAEIAASGKSEDELRGEYRRIAERRVRLGLLLSEVGRQNNIEVKADEVNRAMFEQARRFPGQERKVVEFYQKTPEAMAQLRAPLFEEKVVTFILEMAKVGERKVSPEDLRKALEADTEAPAAA